MVMHWEKVDETYKLTTAGDEYGFFLIPDNHDKSLYDVYMTFGFCSNMQLLSEYAMELNEAKNMAEAIVNKFKTLK